MNNMIVPGECVHVMAKFEDRSIDHIMADPPYSAKVHNAQRRGCTGYVEPTRPNATKAQFNRSRDLGFAPMTEALRYSAAEQFARLVKRWVLVFSDHEGSTKWGQALREAGLEVVRYLIWVKKGSAPQFTGDRPAQGHEVIVLAHQQQTTPTGKLKHIKKKWNGGGKHGVYTHPIVLNRGKKKERIHTAQKPLALMEQFVELFTDPDDLILDPFAGGGTTLLAAHKHGRRWIGIESDIDYVNAAYDRLRDNELEV